MPSGRRLAEPASGRRDGRVRPMSAVAGFLRAPNGRLIMALEALAELGRARVLTALPMRVLTRDLGRLNAAPGGAPADPAGPGQDQQDEAARRIGDTVAAVAGHVPFRALCLQQAIAVNRMLARRGVRAAVYIGVNRDRAERHRAASDRVAHAWVEVGGRVVSGAGDLERYFVIARFG